MNILMVGNGFDLSHYLPTKYDHFMDVMKAIENWDDSNGNMGFVIYLLNKIFKLLFLFNHFIFKNKANNKN